VSIGFLREDGDFHIVATLNNNDNIYSDECFLKIIEKVIDSLSRFADESPYSASDIFILNRQDTPDYVNLDEVELPCGYIMDDMGNVEKIDKDNL
jgi:hypothetical protein